MTLIRNFAENIQSDGDLIITGDLQVDGTTTTVNSTVVDIADKNITLGVGAATNAQNDGAGISILLPDASPDEFATILYTNSSDSWSFNKTVDITGNVSADEVISASIISSSSTNPRLRLFETDTTDLNSQLQSQGGQFLIKTIPDNAATSFIRFMIDHATGDINLGYEDTGASPKLFWDASAESLGIGTDSPSDLMTIQSPAIGGGNGITIKRDDNGTDQRVGGISFGNTVDSDLAQITAQTSTGNNGDGNLLFHTQPNGGVSTERMRITSAGALQLSDVNSPNDINTAIFSNSDVLELEAFGTNGAIAFSTGSGVDERLRITSTGNVGIGTDNPDSNLHIKSTADVKLTLETDEDSNCWINFSGATSEASIGYEPSTNVLKFANASDGVTSNVRMSIDAFGKVGIGNTAPTSNLTIGSAQSDGLEFTFDSTNTYRNRIVNYWNSSNDTRMDFEIGPTGNVAPTAIMSVGYGGNVGIGTTAPTTLLDISHQITTDGVEYPLLIAGKDVGNAVNQLTSSGIGLQFKLAGNNSAGDSLTGASIAAMRENASDADSSTGLAFLVSQNDTTLDEAVRIDHDGNVGIGTASPAVPLHVYNATQGRVAFENASRRFDLSVDADGLGFRDQTAAVTRMILTTAGNVGIGTLQPATALDVTGTITQNTVSRQAITFSIPANVARKVKLTIANYDAFKVTLSAQRSNAGNSMVWWEGYINNNDNVGYANVISSQASGGSISYTFTNNNNGIFEWDFSSSASIAGGTVIIESAGLNLNANLATYSNV